MARIDYLRKVLRMKATLTGRRLYINSGSEGPRHDPYSWKEFVQYERHHWESDLGKADIELEIVLHSGLTGFFGVRDLNNNREWEVYETGTSQGFHSLLFEEYTGMSIKTWQNSYHRIQHPSRCPTCKGPLVYEHGFPGEELLVCKEPSCQSIVSISFNEEAVK